MSATRALIVFIVVAACGTISCRHLKKEKGVADEDVVDRSAWIQYKEKYGKVYTGQQNWLRYNIWKNTLGEIAEHNALYGSTSYRQDVNQFTDVSEDEFLASMAAGLKLPQEYLHHNGTLKRRGETFVPLTEGVKLPSSVDWRTKGYVTEVKNQGHCGSCYGFSATGALEGQWFRKTGKLPSLSEQQIVDCSRKWGNKGCGGGWYQSAWEYMRDVGGDDTETAYPYEAKESQCRFNKQGVGATVQKFVDLPSEDEERLKEAVATVGPVSVAIYVKGSLRKYSGGVYYESHCYKEFWQLNHAVLVVGYGNEDGKDYWLVKNSWGRNWGEQGYFKMSRNRRNNCGIATIPSYPIV